MKKTIALAGIFFFAAFYAGAQQSSFRDTVQVFRSSVADFREDGIMGSFKDGVLVSPSPADLEVGDIFIDVDGNAKKVANIERVGGDLYIDTVAPRMEEVFNYVEIPFQTVAFNEDNFLSESLPSNGRVMKNSKGVFTVSFETEIYKKGATVVKFGADASVTSNISIGFAAPYYYVSAWWWWVPVGWSQSYGYIKGSLDCDLSLTGTLSVALEGSKESDPVLLYGFGTPNVGIAADLGLFTKTILEGSLSLQLPVTFAISGNAGAQCTLAGFVPAMWPTDCSSFGSTSYSLEVAPQFTADASLKQKFYLGAEVTVVGIKITDFEAGGGPYIKVNGTLGASILYDSAEDPALSVTGVAEASGEIGIFLEVNGSIYDGKWSVTVLDKEFPLLTLSTDGGWSSPFISRTAM